MSENTINNLNKIIDDKLDGEINNKKEKEIKNGWEYLTDITPFNISSEQKLQNLYIMNYNLAYHKFLKSLCIEKDALESIIEKLKYTIDSTTNKPVTKYRYIIDTTDDNNIINNDNYPIKFLKTKFINFKLNKLKVDLINYYKPLGFYVEGPLEVNINKKITKYFIELCWN